MKQALVALALLMALPAVAADITITNSDFETQTLNDGQWTNTISGWTLSGSNGGLFNPASSHFSSEGGAGVQGNTAFSNGITISQTLNTNLAVYTTYTLTVDVGNRLDSNFPGYAIELVANGVTLAALGGPADSIANDSFETITLVYTTSPSDPIGYPIEIRLASGATQTNFDNVTLTSGDNPCAAFSTDTIDQDLTLDVSTAAGDFDTIQEALDCLMSKTITGSAIVTIQVADGNYTDYDTVEVLHPQGNQIHIMGNVTDPSAVTITFASGVHGVRVYYGHQLGLIDGMTLEGYDTTKIGLLVTENSFARAGSNLVIENWSSGVQVAFGGMVEAKGTTSRNNSNNGFTVDGGAVIRADNAISEGNSAHGFSISNGSAAYLNGATCQFNGVYGLSVITNGSAQAQGITYNGNGAGSTSTANGGVIF